MASLSPDRIDGQRRGASPSQRRSKREQRLHPDTLEEHTPSRATVLRDNRNPPRSGTFDEGHPIPARRNRGCSRGPQQADEATLKARTRNCLSVVILHCLAQVYHLIFTLFISFFAQGLAHHRLLSYAPWAYFHGNWYGLAFPNCYLRPSIAYLFRKDGMLVNFLRRVLRNRTLAFSHS